MRWKEYLASGLGRADQKLLSRAMTLVATPQRSKNNLETAPAGTALGVQCRRSQRQCPDRAVLGASAIFKHGGGSARLTGACTLPSVPRRKSGSDLIQGTPIFLRSNDRFRGQNQVLNIVKLKNQHFDEDCTTAGSTGFSYNELASGCSRLCGPPRVPTAATQLCHCRANVATDSAEVNELCSNQTLWTLKLLNCICFSCIIKYYSSFDFCPSI